MATPAYVPLNPDTPAGLTQAPDAYSASDLANVRAMRDAIITGAVQGWQYFQSSSSTRPTNRVWAGPGGLQLRMETAHLGPQSMPSLVKWWWSNDTGTTWSQIGTDTVLTWDAGLLICTAGNNNTGSWLSWLQAYMQGVIARDGLAAHGAGSGNAVHGLGTMSTQNANAVAITGGAISGVPLNFCNLTNFGRAYPIAPAVIASGAWNWASGTGNQQKCAAGAVLTIANPVAGEIKRLWVTGPGAITINSGGGIAFQWATGHPVWGGTATLVSCVAVENNYVIGTTIAV